jgi:hypothetical protein
VVRTVQRNDIYIYKAVIHTIYAIQLGSNSGP